MPKSVHCERLEIALSISHCKARDLSLFVPAQLHSETAGFTCDCDKTKCSTGNIERYLVDRCKSVVRCRYPRHAPHLKLLARHIGTSSRPSKTATVRRRPSESMWSRSSRPDHPRRASCRSGGQRSSPTGQQAWNHQEDNGTDSDDSVDTTENTASYDRSVVCWSRS